MVAISSLDSMCTHVNAHTKSTEEEGPAVNVPILALLLVGNSSSEVNYTQLGPSMRTAANP